MGMLTKIQWCHHTWNPWRGCWKISEGCANCYAERDSKRNPKVLGTWGKGTRRSIAAESYWQLPYRWNREAEAAGERRRVFCLSLGDWLELHPDLDSPRARLLDAVARTPWLDWLLLTKRPGDFYEAIRRARKDSTIRNYFGNKLIEAWLQGLPPANIWVGASVENRAWALERIPLLTILPAAVRFLSAEPLLGDLGELDLREIDWVIFGGESGSEDKVRPLDVHWIRDGLLRCRNQDVTPYVKQLGAWVETSHNEYRDALDEFPGEPRLTHGKLWSGNARVHLQDPKGGDPGEWPADLRVREFPR